MVKLNEGDVIGGIFSWDLKKG